MCDYLEPNDRFVTIDLENSFHHININDSFRTYVGFK